MSAEPAPAPVAGGSLSGPGVTAPTLSGAGRRFLSDILVELGFVEQSVADQAVESARRPGMTPEKVLLDSDAISADQLARALAERYALDHIDLDEYPVDRSAAGVLRQTAARRYQAAPIGFTGDGALIVAIADPTDSLGLSDIAVMTKLAVRPAVAARSQIEKILDELEFMDEPLAPGPQTVGTLIVPPEETARLRFRWRRSHPARPSPQWHRHRSTTDGSRSSTASSRRSRTSWPTPNRRSASSASRRAWPWRRRAPPSGPRPRRSGRRRSKKRSRPSGSGPTRRAPRRSKTRCGPSEPRQKTAEPRPSLRPSRRSA